MKKFIKKYSTQIIVTILTTIFLELLLIFSLGIYPFKNGSILVCDLYYEYVPFYNHIRDAILNGKSIFNSFSFTMGQSMVGIISYYCLSPLNLLLLFSNLNNITYFIKILFIIKIVLCALSMSIYLNNKTSKINNIIFSLIFALTTYNLKYGFNIMWLDVIYMLPLTILGLEKMIDGKSSKLYIACLTLMIFSNFYISFSACIFIFIYFLFYSLVNKKLSFKLLYRFIISSIIPVLLTAFMLIPTIYNMRNGKLIEAVSGYDKLVLYNPLNMIYNVAPGETAGHILNDLPYFYSTTLILILFINYLFNSEISSREKILSFGIILFIVFATLFAPLDLLFHCFKVPNSLYYRYIYILSFFLISIVSKNKIKVSYFALIPILLFSIWALSIELSVKMIIFVTLMLVYFFALKSELKYFVVIILFAELFYSSFINIKTLNGYGSYDDVQEYGKLLKEYYPKENEFYRIEVNEPITKNDSFILNYYGIDSFSPTITNTSKIFLKNYLLYAEQHSLNYVYQNRFILDPYFLGVKYELTDNKVVENKNYLPLIVKTNSFDYFKPTNDLIINSNNLYRMINGEYLFKEIDYDIDCIKNNMIISKSCKINYQKKDNYSYYLHLYVKSGNLFEDKPYVENTYIIDIDETFDFDYDNIYIDSAKLYEFNESNIKNQSIDFEIFKDNYIKLNVEKGSYLMMVPYDDSWHIRVNGKEIKKIEVLDSLIGFETDGGVVEIEFIPQGLFLGILISGITSLSIFAYCFRKRAGEL